jgi:allantoin racemase
MTGAPVQRIAVLGSGYRPTGNHQAPPEIARIAGSGFLPELVETRFGAFPNTPYDRGLAAIGYLDAGIKAEQAGYRALFLNTFGDYGIAELRSALGIPVVGAGETALAVAATLGRRFAIVTVWPRSMNFIYDERLAATCMAPRCVGIRNILDDGDLNKVLRGDSDDPISAMRQGSTSARSAAMVDRIVQAAEASTADGAEIIVLGCTCMAPVGALVASRVGAPVIEAMTAGYKMAEMLVSLGLTQSALAFPRPAFDRLQAIDRLISGSARNQPEEDCEVCVFAADEAAE